jgi:hypothetical protein
LIFVIEINGDEDIAEPSDKNIKKNEYALAHFARLNERLEAAGSPVRYRCNFLTEKSFNSFQALRENCAATFRSELDVKLTA